MLLAQASNDACGQEVTHMLYPFCMTVDAVACGCVDTRAVRPYVFWLALAGWHAMHTHLLSAIPDDDFIVLLPCSLHRPGQSSTAMTVLITAGPTRCSWDKTIRETCCPADSCEAVTVRKGKMCTRQEIPGTALTIKLEPAELLRLASILDGACPSR